MLKKIIAVFAALAALMTVCVNTAAAAEARQTLVEGFHYPRVIRLEHAAAGLNGTLIASTNGIISRSSDGGASWTQIATVPNPTGGPFRCCASLYELPGAVGRFGPGTLLSAATVRQGAIFEIDLYASGDQGRSWSLVGMPVRGGSTGGGGRSGVWEPEFTVGRDGALIMFWSDETDPCCSQKLAQMRTYDGVTWRDRRDTLASRVTADRPGMASVSRLPGNRYFMSYEMCGPSAHCAAYFRLSADGWQFGDPQSLGTKVSTAAGQYFVHAPTNAWSRADRLPNGRILLVGQTFHEADGRISPHNGAAVLINDTLDASGPWSMIEAPVKVPGARGDQPCTNYSSALMPSTDGLRLLELASDGTKAQCSTYFATGPVRPGANHR